MLNDGGSSQLSFSWEQCCHCPTIQNGERDEDKDGDGGESFATFRYNCTHMMYVLSQMVYVSVL